MFSFCQGLGEPDWRCSKTGDCMLLSIRWNSKAAENVATGNWQPKEPNSRQRRSKRRLETFIARKRANNDTEAADRPSSRTPEREQPWRQDHRNAQAENASSTLPPVSYADSIKRTLSRYTSSACQLASKSTAKGSEDAIVHKKDNDDAMSRLCNAPSGEPTCTTENRSIMSTTGSSPSGTPTPSLSRARAQPESSTDGESTTELLVGVDLASIRRERVDEVFEGLGLRRCVVKTEHEPELRPPTKQPKSLEVTPLSLSLPPSLSLSLSLFLSLSHPHSLNLSSSLSVAFSLSLPPSHNTTDTGFF